MNTSENILELPDSLTTMSSSEDTNSARAYLQRAEVRLSTMHRIAGAFISGAGLLILAPFFLKDTIISLVTYLALIKKELHVNFFTLPYSIYTINEIISYEFIGYIFSFLLPIGISIYLSAKTIIDLYREILRFYYIPHLLGVNEDKHEKPRYLPRFSLTGIKMSESEISLNTNFQSQLNDEHNTIMKKSFVVPQNQDAEDYISLRALIVESKGEIINVDEDTIKNEMENNKGRLPEKYMYDAAFSLANSYTKPTLAYEVAKMEASLVRHNLFLRRLVFRYVKSVLILLIIGISLMFISSLASLWNKNWGRFERY